MAGWSHQKRLAVERAFYEFLAQCFVNSKDAGRISLGASLYDGQRKFITMIFDGMEEDIHDFFILKSRQLGISTVCRALGIFWLGVHEGLKGALVFDTSPHKDSARQELVTMITDLPGRLKFPAVRGTGRGNRDSLQLYNDSTMLFMSAGVKASKSSGTLGRSEGLTMALLSELCSYQNPEGLKAFEQSLSELHPSRLFIRESTARGFNQWYEIWERACADSSHCKVLFLGFWSKESQIIPRDHIDFEKYGTAEPTDAEQERIDKVFKLYNHVITPEQLAWIRRKVDPTQSEDNDEDDTVMLAEQAWTADEAFQQTGSVFFGNKVLTDQTNKYVTDKNQRYMFLCGDEFASMRIFRAQNVKSVELKVWEEPDLDGEYVFGVDPAYGENENNCRSSIQVFRCYSDGLDQVAEYASPMISTRQFAWAIAALLGWYGAGDRANCRYILELNGPGEAVLNALRELKLTIEQDHIQRASLEEKGLVNVFRNVKSYIYQRPDSMGPGANWHWKTTTQLKITILERLRDFVSNGKLRIRSSALIDEMRTIAREGDSIGAPESMKDDRVLAAALAAYYWDTKIKPGMVAQKRTRDAEAAKRNLSIVDQVSLFHTNQLEAFFQAKRVQRAQAWRDQSRRNWRGR